MNGKEIRVINATAGAGKTTRIRKELDFWCSAMEKGYLSSLYLVYTKHNKNDAVEKLRGILNEKHILTLHSLCYRALKLTLGNELQIAELEIDKFNKIYKRMLTAKEYNTIKTIDDYMLSTYNYIRSKNVEITDVDKYKFILKRKNISIERFKKFVSDWELFKRNNAFLDFHELLREVKVEDFIRLFTYQPESNKEENTFKYVINLFIDEAQDFSEEMWNVVEKILMAKDILNLVIVGDDEQSIYSFLGAEKSLIYTYPKIIAEKFNYKLRVEETFETRRFGSNILEFAKTFSNKDIQTKKEGGVVKEGNFLDFLSIVRENKDKSYFIVVRHNTQVDEYLNIVKKYGLYPMRIQDFKSVIKFYEIIELFKSIKNLNSLTYKQKTAIYKVYKFDKEIKKENIKDFKELTNNDFVKLYKEYNDKYVDILAEKSQKIKKIINTGYLYPVIIGTAHGTKGLESDIVFVDFKHNYISFSVSFLDNSDEKNLYFVAFTRAREYLIYTKETMENARKLSIL